MDNLNSNELYQRGVDYLYGNDVQKDYEKALKCFIKALDFGHAGAMEQIGFMYELGWGFEPDKSEALKWYRRAAEIGDINLENHFAYCLLDGDGIEQNIDEAINWFRKSAALGNKAAMRELAFILFMHKGDEAESFKWLMKYNDGNELAAQACLADIYYSEDPRRAFEIYKEVNDKGENRYYELGEMYLKGIGTEKNLDEAIKWFEKAAQIEDIKDSSDEYCKWDAMLKIAEIYISLKDEQTAIEWLTRRNDGNEISGIRELAHIYYGDNEFEYEDTSLIDKEKACYWFQKLYELKCARHSSISNFSEGEN